MAICKGSFLPYRRSLFSNCRKGSRTCSRRLLTCDAPKIHQISAAELSVSANRGMGCEPGDSIAPTIALPWARGGRVQAAEAAIPASEAWKRPSTPAQSDGRSGVPSANLGVGCVQNQYLTLRNEHGVPASATAALTKGLNFSQSSR